MTTELRDISYVVLALVGEGGAGAHDLARMVRQGGPVYWSGAASKVYAEPKRLERLGYLSGREAPGRTRVKTVYRLTPKGRSALREWLREPARFPQIKDSAHLRLLAGDQIGDAAILASVTAMREELHELRALVDEMTAGESKFSGAKARNLRLAHRLALRVIDAYEGWVGEVEAALGKGGRPRGRAHNRDPG